MCYVNGEVVISHLKSLPRVQRLVRTAVDSTPKESP